MGSFVLNLNLLHLFYFLMDLLHMFSYINWKVRAVVTLVTLEIAYVQLNNTGSRHSIGNSARISVKNWCLTRCFFVLLELVFIEC